MSDDQAWRVYAVRYASYPGARRRDNFYGGDPDGDVPMPLDYFVWAVVGHDRLVMVDAGFTAETARRRSTGREHIADPFTALREALGVDPAQASDLILTHLHYDHTGYLTRHTEARVHVQRREMEFWTGPWAHRGQAAHMAVHEDVADLVRADKHGQVRQYDGDAEIAPGVSVHLLGGHTPGTQVVRVQADPETTIVLASDASHFYENYETDRPFSIVHTVPMMHASFDRITELAGPGGIVVPGHDPQVADRFETIDTETRLVTRIA
jgi:glyoxylase-like metal-dependent hydrolase (beta-lactamase superfamily II)